MSAAVLEVTSEAVWVSSGGTGGRPSRALAEAALDWVDDPVGLLDGRPVAVADMWRSLAVTMLGPRCESVVVVHPLDWPRARVDRVMAAANTVTDHVRAEVRDLPAPALAAPAVPAAPERLDGAVAAPEHGVAPRGVVGRPGTAMLASAAVLLLVGAAVLLMPGSDSGDGDGTTVVEGRMAVRIPAQWTVRRVIGGPGSRRLQASAAGDPEIALHVTSSYAPGTTLGDAAGILAAAIADEPPGVFVDFRPEATVAGRASVTYREARPGRVIAWTVVLAGSTRIGIGCQSPPGREDDVRAACDEAVRSAHEP